MKNSSRLKKLFYGFIAFGLVLQVVIVYMYYKINLKSSKMLHHRTAITKNFSDIRYHIANAHLWLSEYKKGDKVEKQKVFGSLCEVKKNLEFLIELEKKKVPVNTSKHRDAQYILSNFIAIQKELLLFEKLTLEYMQNGHSIGSSFDKKYDKAYSDFINTLERFDKELDSIFYKVLKEFNQFKDRVYILMFTLIVFSVLFIFVIIRKEIKRAKEIEKQNEIIQKQSQMAAMGEMVDAIAHQWKQPLNNISMNTSYIGGSILDDDYEVDKKEIYECHMKVKGFISHLLSTLEEFRSFFRPDKEPEEVVLKELIESTLLLTKDDLIKHRISTSVLGDTDSKVKVIKNEWKHILLNLISNSKDAFNENNIQDRKIFFHIKRKDKNITLKIIDNAGGIPKSVIGKIFEHNFTTKQSDKGTGIGLYITKLIVEKNQGKIDVSSYSDRTTFSVTFNI